MNNITYYQRHDELEIAASLAILHTDVVIDIGCGIRPMTTFRPLVHICFEPFDAYATIMQRRFTSEPGLIVLKAMALDGLNMLNDKSVDSIFLLDVIEHMLKEDGLAVLKECERVARRQIVVSTPLGYMPQDYEAGELDAWDVAHNKLQSHLSGWMPEDFPPHWRHLICADYHKTDNKSEPLEKPIGVLYAICDFEQRPSLPSRPMLVGKTIPPKLIDGQVRDSIVEIFAGFDPSSFAVSSPDDASPYTPLYNIPDLKLFSTRRLDCKYHQIQWPKGWTSLPTNAVPFRSLSSDHQLFLIDWAGRLTDAGHRSLILTDFGMSELLLVHYVSELLRMRVGLLSEGEIDTSAELGQLIPGEAIRFSGTVDQIQRQLSEFMATDVGTFANDTYSLKERSRLAAQALKNGFSNAYRALRPRESRRVVQPLPTNRNKAG
jgi:hypothetical protein